MRYAVISDIHGNLEALQTVLDDIAEWGECRIVCLGDVVGYGADPCACVELVMDRVARDETNQPLIVSGNHDYAVATDNTFGFQEWAVQAVQWTRAQVPAEMLAVLFDWPYSIRYEELMFVHATPDNPQFFTYVKTLPRAQEALDACEAEICFLGHTHQPFVIINQEPWFVSTGPEIGPLQLIRGARYLVNVGSVGQPRDQDPRAGYARYDLEAGTLEIRRVPYPHEQAAAKIHAAGLPDILAWRLGQGW